MATSNLPRVIGVSGVAFTAFNCVVGVGIFGLPGIVAGVLGPAAILAYVVCLVLFGLIALCLAEAGSRVTSAGGLYAYASAAFGPVVGGVAGVLMVLASSVGSAAAITRFFLDTLTGVWPFLADPVWNFAALVLLYGSIALVNIIGTRDGNSLTIAIGYMKFVPLALLVIVGAFFVVPANLEWMELPPAGKIGDALPREWRNAGEHLVEQDAERVKIGARVHRFAAHLLRRHVGERSDQVVAALGGRDGLRRVVEDGSREPEVEDLGDAARRDHHVRGLEVAVDDAEVVRGIECRGHLHRDRARPDLGQRTARQLFRQ